MLLASLVVTNTGDSGPGTLRQAILAANADNGRSTITFAIPGSGVHVIAPAAPLPSIVSRVLIDGTSQAGYVGTPLVEIDGRDAGPADGLSLVGSGATIRGLSIVGFASGAAVSLSGPAAFGNQVSSNSLGVAPGGSVIANAIAVRIAAGAHDNTIGGTDPALGNVIAYTTGSGVVVTGNDSVGNRINSNRIRATGRDVRFSGDGGHVQLPSFPVGGAMTVEAWVWSDDVHASWARVFDFGDGPGVNEMALDWLATTGQMNWTNQDLHGNWYGIQTAAVFPQGRWVHVAATVDDGGNAAIYWDGVQVASGWMPAPPVLTRTRMYLARSIWEGDAPLSGAMHDVAIWSGARTIDQIRADMVRPPTGSELGLLASYRLDESQGLTVRDASPYHRDGMLAATTGGLPARELRGGPAIDLGGDGLTANARGFGAGPGGVGIALNGEGSHVQLLSFPLGGELTLEAWVWSDDVHAYWARVFNFADGPGSHDLNLTFVGDTGQMALSVDGKDGWGYLQTSQVFPQGRWVHVGATIFDHDHDGGFGAAQIFWDGQVVASGPMAVPPALSRSQMYLGRSSWAQDAPLAGAIRDVSIWSGPRDLYLDMSQSPNGSEPGLLAYYPLDTRDGMTTPDRGPGRRDGTIVLSRVGPNWLPNYPTIVATTDGKLRGYLVGGLPGAAYRVEVFAGASYGVDYGGTAEVYLGALKVTTDDSGRAVFDVPFTAPAGRPVITATATDASGNTSEVSTRRIASLTMPSGHARLTPGQPLVFTASGGDGVALLDPVAGTSDPAWEITLSVPSGTLSLSRTTGLTGSGNGGGSLRYRGSLSAINAALEGLKFTPPAGFHGTIAIHLAASSYGAADVEADVVATDGVFPVTTTADSGAGSLRQAILDANATAGLTTIAFAVPGGGLHVIAPSSPLPAIIGSVRIDGTTQAGYAGSPLILLSGESAGAGDGLTLRGSGTTVIGLAIGGFLGGAGIRIDGADASGNAIVADQIGIDPVDGSPRPNNTGIRISGGAHDNSIGGADAVSGNVIANNPGSGVIVEGDDSRGNRISGNRIFGNGREGARPAGAGRFLQFDGSGGDVDMPSASYIPASFTFEAWVASDDIHAAGAKVFDFGDLSFGWLDASGRMTFTARGPDGQRRSITTDAAFPEHRWLYVAATVDAQGNGAIYWDGSVVASGLMAPIATGYGDQKFLGRSTTIGDAAFIGAIDEVKLWNVSRTAEEVRSDMMRVGTDTSAGLLAYLPLDQSEGTDVPIASVVQYPSVTRLEPGNGNLPTWSAAGQSIDVGNDGPTPTQPNYVQLPSFQFGGAITIEAWVESDDVHASWARVLDFADWPGINEMALAWAGTTGQMNWADQDAYGNWYGIQTTAVFPQGRWVHVAATVDDQGNGAIYWDGVLVASGSMTAPPALTRRHMYLARSIWENDAPLNGALRGVSLWTGARTADQVRADMTAAPDASAPGLVAYYPLDGAGGMTVRDAGPSHYDGTIAHALPGPFPNAPIIAVGADGKRRGWLEGAIPGESYRIEIFASAGAGPGMTGQAEAFLGAIQVTADGFGRVAFDVPFDVPSDRPVVTATATDSQGNTSELSMRQSTLVAPTTSFHVTPGRPLVFSSEAGAPIILSDPGTGPIDTAWELTLSAADGTLRLASLAGLTGSGDGTGVLHYRGGLTAIDAALQGLTFTPADAFHGASVIRIDARSDGVVPLHGEIRLTDGIYRVTTTLNAGPGSLRQAILDADNTVGEGVSTILFAIPGDGVQTIVLDSSLTISASMLIDGFSQPGYAGSPRIELVSADTGAALGTGLGITGSGSTVRGLAIGGFNTGIQIGASNVGIYANVIGADASGTVARPNNWGITIDYDGHDNTIGGTAQGLGNLIAFNNYFGVAAWVSFGRNRISGNRIFANGWEQISAYPDMEPPVIVEDAEGKLRGYLAASPDASYHLEFFASPDFAPGSDQAEFYVGSLEVTTDDSGRAVFDVPFAAPASNPLLTATATDAAGNTSRLSSQRSAYLNVPTGSTRILPGQAVTYSASLGDGIALVDSSVGPLDPVWDVTLTATSGSLTLSRTYGLTGSGDGTGSLHYRGSLSALNAALEGLTFVPSEGSHGFATMSLSAESLGAPIATASWSVTDAVYVVTTTDEWAPGSLGQAILDANATPGGERTTILFAIPGAGVHSIRPTSPLPGISVPVLLDGFSQAGYAGSPLIELDGFDAPYDSTFDGLQIYGSGTTIRGLAIGNFARGILISTYSSGNTIYASNIGTDASGTIARPNARGIVIDYGASDNTVGGTGPDQGNLIAFNIEYGVEVVDGTLRNRISGNRIFANQFASFVVDQGGQPAPIVLTGLDGQRRGVVNGPPNATLRLEFFAASGFGQGGGGDAEAYLGSIDVTTDGTGLAVFDIPFALPAGFSLITATATDPSGNTSQLSSRRVTWASAPPSVILLSAGKATLSSGVGDGLSLVDPQAAPLDPVWSLSLTASSGVLNLATTAGLTGFGDGSGQLRYRGGLTALNAALESLRFTAAPDFHGIATLTLIAQSEGADDITATITLTDGVFRVTSTADDGPGSLRQAILDLNAVGANGTILIDLPVGVERIIRPLSSLPQIARNVLIDASGDPGPASGGAVRILGNLPVFGAEVTLRGVTLSGTVLDDRSSMASLRLPAVAVSASDTVQVDTYSLELLGEGGLLIEVLPRGMTTRLVLRDPTGRALVQDDGSVASDGEVRIRLRAPIGTYSIEVISTGGSGSYALRMSDSPVFFPGQPIPIALAGYSIQLASGDFNNDGVVDLIATDGVRLGNGDGTFGSRVDDPRFWDASFHNGWSPYALTVADFNRDGDLDVALLSYWYDAMSGTYVYRTAVLLGLGDGTFQAARDFAAGTDPRDMVAGDFNGDGVVDLATINNGSRDVSVLLGNGDGTFRSEQRIAPASDSDQLTGFGLTAGDFDGDGRLDLATPSYDEHYRPTTTVFYGEGGGTFRPSTQVGAGFTVNQLVAADINNDGRADLVGLGDSDAGSFDTMVLLGRSDGTFADPMLSRLGAGLSAVAVGDFDGDGRPDVAGGSDGSLTILMGNGDGTFRPLLLAQPATALVPADFNGDGRLDLGIGYAGIATVLLGTGDGGSQGVDRAVSGSAPVSPVTGDFDGDGRLDVATVNPGSHDISLLLGDGDGTFQPDRRTALVSSAYPYTLVAGDFNNDGRLDLATNGTILLGNGDGTFQARAFATSGSVLVAADFNGDGKLDLVALGSTSLGYLAGKGDGTFFPERKISDESSSDDAARWGFGPEYFDPRSVLLARDFDGDGRLDLVITTPATGGFALVVGNGDGTFRAQRQVALPPLDYYGGPGFSPPLLAAGDLDHDGRIDLFSGVVIRNMTGGNFTSFSSSSYVNYSTSVVIDDFDGDGNLDVATRLGVILGLDHGFDASRDPIPFPASFSPLAMVVGDFNGDGHLDLASANFQSNTVTVVLGKGDGSFTEANALSTSIRSAPLIADADGDGATDVFSIDTNGRLLFRRGQPSEPGAFDPYRVVDPGSSIRDIAFVPHTRIGPILAAVDAAGDFVTLYVYRDGDFVRVGTLATGSLPAQIESIDLNRDGWEDLVVRNAGDGSLSVFYNNELGSLWAGLNLFRSPVRLDVGAGASDVAAVDTTGTGRLDLLVANRVSGQVSVLRSREDLPFDGRRSFDPPAPYRAGTSSAWLTHAMDGSTGVASFESTAGAVAGDFNGDGRVDLLALNSGTNTLGLVAGLGQGRFANPRVIQLAASAKAIRAADLDHDGHLDLALLGDDSVSVLLGDGRGGFTPRVRYPAGSNATGLRIADADGDGNPDLLVGNTYGDVFILSNQGDGTFRPYQKTDRAIALAVADLNGNGSRDVIYANQGLDRVVVDYGGGDSATVGDRSSGLLAPGAVKLADLDGDGQAELIVANSGSNNVLVYPGLGDGQFGPALNGNGFYTGMNPAGITVGDVNGDGRPDLVVANKGSNDVSILLNEEGDDGFTFGAGPRLKAGAGPVDTVLQDADDDGKVDLLVSNSQSNDVTILTGTGGGFFNDQQPRTIAVGNNPGPIFAGNFDGNPGLVAVNTGSNSLTVISNFTGSSPITTTIFSGGVAPLAAIQFRGRGGFDGLIVANHDDGALSLFQGSSEGLALTSTTFDAGLPSPTSLAFAAFTGEAVEFYAATEGQESAILVALSLGGAGAVVAPTSPTEPAPAPVPTLVALQETSLAIVGSLLIAVLTPGVGEEGAGVTAPAAEGQSEISLGARGVAVGQGFLTIETTEETSGGEEAAEEPEEPADAEGEAAAERPLSWQRMVLGIEEALEELDRELDSRPSAEARALEDEDAEPAAGDAQRVEAIDRAVDEWPAYGEARPGATSRSRQDRREDKPAPTASDPPRGSPAALVGVAAAASGYLVTSGRFAGRTRAWPRRGRSRKEEQASD